jgi:hypothetical protein
MYKFELRIGRNPDIYDSKKGDQNYRRQKIEEEIVQSPQ